MKLINLRIQGNLRLGASAIDTPPPAPAPSPSPSPSPAPAPSPDNLPDGWPRRIVGIYFESYFDTEPFTINQIPTTFNVIFLFHCKFNADGSPRFDHHPTVTQTQIQTCRNRGQKVILTVGGSNNHFTFTNRTQSTNFVNGFISIANVMGGVDGCDFNNYEQVAPTQAFIDEMVWIAQQLRTQYGSNFAITSPPQPNSTNDRNLLTQMHNNGVLTFCQPQYYDWVGFKDVGFISTRTNDWVSAVGATKTMLGLAANYDPANSPTLSEGTREWDIAVANHPTLRGVMGWNARNNNFDANNSFGTTWKAKMDALA